MSSSIGERITIARREKGMSQLELAKAMGTSQTNITRWESSDVSLKDETINKLHEILGVSCDWLITGAEETDKGLWNQLIKTYDNYEDQFGTNSPIAPVAHTRITARIAILINMRGEILAATIGKESVFAPCTSVSECRSNNIAPHLIHDNIGYVVTKGAKHDAYMEQLKEFNDKTNNVATRAVYNYLIKNTIADDIKGIVDCNDPKNKGLVIAFMIKDIDTFTLPEWSAYYVSTLPKNGTCAITGEEDYIPEQYPGNIVKAPNNLAKLFAKGGMLAPGYIASQKICHTLQYLCGGWIEQDKLDEAKTIVFDN